MVRPHFDEVGDVCDLVLFWRALKRAMEAALVFIFLPVNFRSWLPVTAGVGRRNRRSPSCSRGRPSSSRPLFELLPTTDHVFLEGAYFQDLFD